MQEVPKSNAKADEVRSGDRAPQMYRRLRFAATNLALYGVPKEKVHAVVDSAFMEAGK